MGPPRYLTRINQKHPFGITGAWTSERGQLFPPGKFRPDFSLRSPLCFGSVSVQFPMTYPLLELLDVTFLTRKDIAVHADSHATRNAWKAAPRSFNKCSEFAKVLGEREFLFLFPLALKNRRTLNLPLFHLTRDVILLLALLCTTAQPGGPPFSPVSGPCPRIFLLKRGAGLPSVACLSSFPVLAATILLVVTCVFVPVLLSFARAGFPNRRRHPFFPSLKPGHGLPTADMFLCPRPPCFFARRFDLH